jgi:superfamily II DNA or RNA helicase
MKHLIVTYPRFNKIQKVKELFPDEKNFFILGNNLFYWKDVGYKFLSIKKAKELRGFVGTLIIDDFHQLSIMDLKFLQKFFEKRNYVAFTNILTERSRIELSTLFNMEITEEYYLHEAVEEYIIPDYEINVVQVDLDEDAKALYDSAFELGEIQVSKKAHKYMTDLTIGNCINKAQSRINYIEEFLKEHYTEKIVVNSSNFASISATPLSVISVEMFNNNEIKHLVTASVVYEKLMDVKYYLINHANINPEIIINLIMESYNMDFNNYFGQIKIYFLISTEWERKVFEEVEKYFNPNRINYV